MRNNLHTTGMKGFIQGIHIGQAVPKMGAISVGWLISLAKINHW
ncbi:hypothetical protein BGS_0743 [Beggiatoa sp. SS]|nr:hypothetical protein BGS_0743 [Beggiatoa sp. SS]